MSAVTGSIRVNAPPHEVWAFFLDHDNTGKWLDGLVRIEKLTEGPVGLGTRFSQTFSAQGRESTFVYSITEFEPERRYGTAIEESGIPSRSLFELREEGGGTVVRCTETLGAQGCAALIWPFVKRWMKRPGAGERLTRDLRRLKLAIEKG